MKNRILATLTEASEGLKLLDDDYYIIGSSALILSGIDIGITHDIDILTTSHNSDILQKAWNNKLIENPGMKESDLFKSNFACFQFRKMQIEAIGNLNVFKESQWIPLNINDYNIFTLNDLKIKIPTLTEQIRILNLFGRSKDLLRISIINKYLDK